MRRFVYKSTKILDQSPELNGLAGLAGKMAYNHSLDCVTYLGTSVSGYFRFFEDGSAFKVTESVASAASGGWIARGSISANLAFRSDGTGRRIDPQTGGLGELILTGAPSALWLLGSSQMYWEEAQGYIFKLQSSAKIDVYKIGSDKVLGAVQDAGDASTGNGWDVVFAYKPGLMGIYRGLLQGPPIDAVLSSWVKILRVRDIIALNASVATVLDTALPDGDFSFVGYSRWNQLFWGFNDKNAPNDLKIHLFADVVQPDAISDPVLLNLTPPVNVLQGSIVEVAVTSSIIGHTTGATEPVPDWLVDWSLTGPGTLRDAQSKTNSAGKAQTFYFGPIDDAGLPDTAQITAQITD